ncbi:MAG: Rrf2 family transcriptional regulator [Planctomycetes bacterium]|nr:Rrf2 family transcriptional regulator [Planctomycetota bacterium]
MISKTAEYAIRASICIAGHSGQACTTQQIAAATGIPAGYLSKVLQLLGREGLVRAQPGPGGGFLLARAADQICVLDVIQAVEPLPRFRECPAGIPEHVGGLCPLHTRLDQVFEAVEKSLRACTLAELLVDSKGSVQKKGDPQ